MLIMPCLVLGLSLFQLFLNHLMHQLNFLNELLGLINATMTIYKKYQVPIITHYTFVKNTTLLKVKSISQEARLIMSYPRTWLALYLGASTFWSWRLEAAL